MATLVMKFGGSLLKDAKHLARVAQIIHAESLAWERMAVVVSAAHGVTDSLRQAVDAAAASSSSYRKIVAEVRDRHLILVNALIAIPSARGTLVTQFDRILSDVLSLCDSAGVERGASAQVRDAVMSAGEQLMVILAAALVRQEGLRAAVVDAGSVILTDETYQNAHPISDLIDERVDSILRPLLDAQIVPILAGFTAISRLGTITTLGRGGSDYTATLLAAALRADEIWIWTSVDGIMSADPQLVPGARVISSLSYEEVSELSYFGARVLHPRAVEPLQLYGIPLRVRNPFNLDHAGTLVQSDSDEGTIGARLKAVSSVDGLCLYSSGKPIDIYEILSQVHRLVGSAVDGPVISLQSHYRSALVFVVPTSEGPTGLDSAVHKLSVGLPHWEVQPVKVIALMGAPSVNETLQAANIRPIASAFGPGDRQILAVHAEDAKAVVRYLHRFTEQADQQFWPQLNSRPTSL